MFQRKQDNFQDLKKFPKYSHELVKQAINCAKKIDQED